MIILEIIILNHYCGCTKQIRDRTLDSNHFHHLQPVNVAGVIFHQNFYPAFHMYSWLNITVGNVVVLFATNVVSAGDRSRTFVFGGRYDIVIDAPMESEVVEQI
jgi:hypothetical protein